MDLAPIGRTLLVLGLVVAALGLALSFSDRVPFGRLPGDLAFRGDGWTVYVPIATSILLSVLLTAAFGLVTWLRR